MKAIDELTNKYDVIVVDPPWPMKKTGKRKSRPNQGVDLDYPTMGVNRIKALPVRALAADSAVLFLWTTHGFLKVAFDVMLSWGFRYQRCLTWDKKNGMCLGGFHHRTEFCLFGYCGTFDSFPKRKAIPTVFSEKSNGHSVKPDVFYELVAPIGLRRIDVFARKERAGWTVWGDEVITTESHTEATP